MWAQEGVQTPTGSGRLLSLHPEVCKGGQEPSQVFKVGAQNGEHGVQQGVGWLDTRSHTGLIAGMSVS